MATLVYSDAGGASTRYQLHGKSILIGAGPECAIRSGDPTLSPKHARLFERDGEYWIEDLGSSAGVFVGEKKVSESRVPFGELVVVGSLTLRIDDGNSESNGSVDPAHLLRLLAAAGERQKQLEEERNALGARLGELHAELTAAKQAVSEAKEKEGNEPTLPMSGFDPVGLERLASDLRDAEKARREIEAKINAAQRKRAKTESEMQIAASDTSGGDVAEMELKQVQMLALQAQMAEADKSVERLRGQLKTRNAEIAALRARARKQTGSDIDVEDDGPKTTKPYAVPAVQDPESDKRLIELKERFEAQFTRAVTLQRKLKTAETRLVEAEKLKARAEEADALEAKNKELAAEIASLKEAAGPTDELETLERKHGDLKKLLEGAQRENSALRGKVTAAKEEAAKAASRAEALEAQVAESAAKVIEQAENLVKLGAEVEEKTAQAAAKDRELTEMAAAVAISAESAQAHENLEKQVAALQTDLDNARAAIKKIEAARDSAQGARRELEAKIVSAKSQADEGAAKLAHAERRVAEAQSARDKAEAALAEAKKDVVAAREARLRAEELLADKNADPNRDNTAVISLKRRISENQEEAAAEIDRLTDRLREIETDLDRALDAEQAALARADADAAAATAKLERLTEERDGLEEELDSVRAKLDEALASTNAQTSRLRELEAQLAEQSARLQEQDAKLSEQAASLEAALDDDSTDHAMEAPSSQDSVVELASQNAKLSSELSALEEQAVESAAKIEALERMLEEAKAELDRTTTLQNRLEETNQDLTRRYEAVAEKLEASSQDVSLDEQRDLIKECQALRERVAELETSLGLGDLNLADLEEETTSTGARIETLSDIEEFTARSEPTPALVEWMNNLHEAITDLRKQMRAASDEAAVMSGDGESLDVVNTALSSAVERVEVARDALARIADMLGLG